MNTPTQSQPEPETVPQDQSVSQQDNDLQTIVAHLGPEFRVTPIGSRRYRCNKYVRPSALYPTGQLAETFVLRVTGTGVEKLSDHQRRSSRTRTW